MSVSTKKSVNSQQIGDLLKLLYVNGKELTHENSHLEKEITTLRTENTKLRSGQSVNELNDERLEDIFHDIVGDIRSVIANKFVSTDERKTIKDKQ